jgi:hypothetical protein
MTKPTSLIGFVINIVTPTSGLAIQAAIGYSYQGDDELTTPLLQFKHLLLHASPSSRLSPTSKDAAHYLQFLVFWRRLGDVNSATEWLGRVRWLAYQSATVDETEGVVHGIDTPTEHGITYTADASSTGWVSPLTFTSQAKPLKVDPRRERWEPKEWEVDSYGWIRRRRSEDVGMYSLASEWMGRWKIRRIGFEDRTPELLKLQESSKSGDVEHPSETLDKDP